MSDASHPFHVPVMASEVAGLLCRGPGGAFVDGTVGGGGHSRALLEAGGPEARVLGLDRDPEALEASRMALAEYGGRFRAVHAHYAGMGAVLSAEAWPPVDGVLLDLGVSSHQLDSPGRGFAFRLDAPLDMRLDPTRGRTAADLLRELSPDEVACILRDYGEEPWARRIAEFIARRPDPPATTGALAEIVKAAIPRRAWPPRIHPATRTFQALRMAVNDELGALEAGIAAAHSCLKVGGRLVIIAYHSLEDRLVKQTFGRLAQGCICPPNLPICDCSHRPEVKLVTHKALLPQPAEVAANPRSRSARLRVAEKLGPDA